MISVIGSYGWSAGRMRAPGPTDVIVRMVLLVRMVPVVRVVLLPARGAGEVVAIGAPGTRITAPAP